MAETKIEWATKVWNPLRGCSKVSEGCRSCYAIRQAHRFSGPGMPYEGLTQSTDNGPNWTGKVMLVPNMLEDPLKWKQPERIFVNSMSDLFHKDVPQPFIDQVFEVMARAKQHTFMILTKRPERMRDYMNGLPKRRPFPVDSFPLPNVWLGVSVEYQQAADERIPLLLQTPAAVRFLSCEPLLGPVDFWEIPSPHDGQPFQVLQPLGSDWSGVNWVIAGGESGPGARPAHPDWFRSLRDQCQAAGVAFHFKQWGEWAPGSNFPDYIPSGKSHNFGQTTGDDDSVWKVGKKTAGRLLDGRTWDEFPEVQG